MPTSPRGADELVAGQAVPETTVNETIRHTEAGACHFPVVDKDLTAPPGSCTDGANYIIAATATGAWAGKETQIATALGTNAANGWRYHVPIEGFTAYVQDENSRYLFGGVSWAVDTTGGSYTDENAQDAVGSILTDSSTIDFTYDDATPSITASVIASAVKPTESLVIACSDETTALTTGTAKITFRMPYAFTLTAVRASLTTAQTSGSILTVDINEGGTTILSTKLTIDNAEKTSTTAATAPVISDSSLADDAEMTIDIDQIGDGTAKGLKVVLIGSRT